MASTVGSLRTLYTQPTVIKFGSRQADELGRYLRQLDHATTIYPISDVTELQLKPDCSTVRDGYRYTRGGFIQVAQLAAPGLSKLLPDLAGMVHRAVDRESLVDGAAALRMFNDMLDLRYPLFRQYRMIRNDVTKQIEGFVGNKHQFLENYALYEQASISLESNKPGVVMHSAALYGRRMAVWFRSREPFCSLTVDAKPWPLYYGYYFCNGEATGTAVRGTLTVFTRKGVCLGPFKKFGGKVAHTGKDFPQRLGAMFEDVTGGDVPFDELKAGAEKLLQASLGFDVARESKSRRQRVRQLAHSLSHAGVPKALALEVVSEALSNGRHAGDPDVQQTFQMERLYASRRLFDLFVPLMRTARQLDFGRREKVEQAAFELLIGKVII